MERSMMHIWCPMKDLKKNQTRQPEVEVGMNSQRKTEIKDPNSKEEGMEEYYKNQIEGWI